VDWPLMTLFGVTASYVCATVQPRRASERATAGGSCGKAAGGSRAVAMSGARHLSLTCAAVACARQKTAAASSRSVVL
jgi:hypothetical protein